MKITIESTTKIVKVYSSGNEYGIECRVWEGITERGVKVQCLIPRIAVALGRRRGFSGTGGATSAGQDISQFEAELQEQRPPSAEVSTFPLRMIL